MKKGALQGVMNATGLFAMGGHLAKSASILESHGSNAEAPKVDAKNFLENTAEGQALVSDLMSHVKSAGDVVGGSMADVVDNTAKLSDEDRLAIARYLKAILPLAKAPK